jgi:NB-ARC domain-containing protein
MVIKLNLDGLDHESDLPESESNADSQSRSLYGSIGGQVAVGRYILHIGASCGGVIERASSEQSHFHPRPRPILISPGVARGLLDRHDELTEALSAVDIGLSIGVSGDPGAGKTAFLRQLAHHSGAAAFVDGVVYLVARHQSSADLQQLIFEAFYESSDVCKPTETQIRRALQETQALVLLDDVDLPQDELEHVLDLAPRSAFAIVTREPCPGSEVRAVVIRGLPTGDAALLLEREVGRTLNVSERSAAAALCMSLDGHPLRVRQVAAIVRDQGVALEKLARDLAPEHLLTEVMASLDDKQRRMLLAMAAVPNVPLQLHHVSGLADVTDLEPAMAILARRGLVVRSDLRYRLAHGVSDRLRQTEDLNPWGNRAITYFTAWAERYRRNQNTLLEDSEALLRVQQHAIEMRRWGEGLRLGQLLECALVVGARWGAWTITLERCLAAAKAMGDRAAEAWVLHESGTRALCLGEPATARRLLNQALSLREAMDDNDATAASRRNLSFVQPPVPPPPPVSRPPVSPPLVSAPPASVTLRERPTTPHDDHDALDSLPIRERTQLPVGVAAKKRSLALPVTASVFVLLGVFAYWAGDAGFSWRSLNLANIRLVPQNEIAETEVTIATPPQPARRGSRPSVLRFSAFPDQIAPGESLGLCYEVANGTRARIDPDIGEVRSLQSDCVRTRPVETTTYTLTAESESGERVRQTVLVRVGPEDSPSRVAVADRANILIFSPRPGSIVTGRATALCYALSGALHARVDPGVGEVNPASALTCVRVRPPRTTTYQLTAYGRDGFAVRQQLVLVVR